MKAFAVVVYFMIGLGMVGQWKESHPDHGMNFAGEVVVMAMWPIAVGVLLADALEEIQQRSA